MTYHDIEAIDPDYFKNLKWMLEVCRMRLTWISLFLSLCHWLTVLFACDVQNDISDVLDLTFSIDADEEKLILYERTEVMRFPFLLN